MPAGIAGFVSVMGNLLVVLAVALRVSIALTAPSADRSAGSPPESG
jgi:hypothetical protein